jgi:hypothetical protein
VRLTDAAVVVAGILAVVFGTYGTSRMGLTFSGTIYAGPTMLAIMIAAGALLAFGFVRGQGLPTRPLLRPEAALFLILLLLVPVGGFRLAAAYWKTPVVIVTLSAVVVLVVVSQVTTARRMRRAVELYQSVIYGAAWLAIVSGIWSMRVGAISVGPIHIEYNPIFWRMNAWFNNSTMLGLFFCHAIFAVYYFLRRKPGALARGVHLLSGFAFLVGMMLAGGRTGASVGIAAFLALVAIRVRRNPRWIGATVAAGALVFFTAAKLIERYGEQIYMLRRFQAEDLATLGGRTAFAREAFDIMHRADPLELLFGHGINATRESLHLSDSIHSGLLRMLLEHGLIFTFVLGLFMLAILGRLLLTPREARASPAVPESEAIALALIAFFLAEAMVVQLFGVDLFFVMFLVVFGCYLGSISVAGRPRPRPGPELERQPVPAVAG